MKQLIYILMAGLICASCGKKQANNTWLNTNVVRMAIDASFESVMRGETEAFANKHIEAEMEPIYTSEDSVIWMLMKDSVRLGIATRMLTDDERAYIKTMHRHEVRHQRIAYDAFALIVNKECTDTVITTDEIRGIVTGQITRWEQLSHSRRKGDLQLVFDQSGSSTVRFMRDSLNNGKPLSGNIFAQGSSPAVIEAVKADPYIIGVVSTDWLRGAGQTAMSDFHGLDVNVMLVSRGKNAFDMSHVCRPYQYYIATGDYPLVRSVYAIITDPDPRSMTTNMFFFLKGDGGQRIICNDSQLLPYLGVQVRDVNVR